jgi:hypothetical protein
MSRTRLPNSRGAEICMFEHDDRLYRATFGCFDNGNLGEIFLDVGKAVSTLQQHADAAAVLASLLLQNDVPSAVLWRSISGPIRTALDLLLERSAP